MNFLFSKMIILFSGFIASMLLVSQTQAEDPCKDVEERVATGTVATVGSYLTDATVQSDVGGSPGDLPSVVKAGVQVGGSGDCKVVFSNTSSCVSYSVFYRVNQGESNATTLKQIFSSNITLPPRSEREKSFSCNKDSNYSVDIVRASGKKK